MTTIPYSTTAAICQGSSKSRDEAEESIRDVSISDAHIPVEVPPLDAPIDLPPVTALLGQCEDTLPVLFDLADSRPGPLLILGDAGCGKQRLLVQIAESLIEGNPPDDIRFTIISSHPDKWQYLSASLKRKEYWMNIDNPVSLEPGEQIIKLAEMAEEKFLQSRDKPVILALVDDLSFLPKSDSTVQLNFSWLCENGPLVQVWLIAALETQAALSMGRWIRYFKTRILGKMEQASADRLGLASSSMSESLIAGIQFAVLINNTWYHFHLPGRHPRGRNRT